MDDEARDNNPILQPLTDSQVALLATVYQGLVRSDEWPIWQYVELTLDQRHGLDAGEVLLSLPRISRPQPMLGAYYLLSGLQFGNVPAKDQRVGLTIGGMTRLVPMPDAVGLFMTVLGELCDRYARLRPDPQSVVEGEVPLRALLPTPLQGPGVEARVQLLRRILESEPPTWGLVVEHGSDPVGVRLEARLRRFRGLGADSSAYLNRVYGWLGPDRPSPPPMYQSPLTLPVSLEYFDEAFKTFAGGYLLGRVRASRLAILALNCNSPEEFDARVSALCEVLNRMRVPVTSPSSEDVTEVKTLQRLESYLGSRLPADSMGRVSLALRELRAITRIRAWRQHGSKGPTAFADLGLSYPPQDWGVLWDALRGHAVTALDAIREEVQSVTSEST